MDEWKYIDEIVVNENINSFHCDTRDFYIFATEQFMEKELRDFIEKIKQFPPILEACIFENFDEAKNYLKDLEKASGGKGEWRMLNFNLPVNSSKYFKGWYKYIRFAKTELGWFCYTTEGADHFVIRKDFMNEKTIDKEYLNFIEKD